MGNETSIATEIRRAEQQLNHTDPLMVTEARSRIVAAAGRVERLEQAVRDCRQAQRDYFLARARHDGDGTVRHLKRAKQYEHELDILLAGSPDVEQGALPF